MQIFNITPISSHLDSSLLSNIEIIFEEKSTISNESVKNINDLILTEFEGATKIKSVYKKEGIIPYIETQFEDKGKVLVLISKVVPENKRLYILYDKFILGCNGSCDGTTFDCSLNNFGSVGVHTYCNCNIGNCSLKIVPFRNHYYF